MSVPPIRRGHLAALILAAASWGVATAISKRAVDEIPPLVLLPVQLGVSVLASGVVLAARDRGLRALAATGRLGALGLLNPGLAYMLGLLGLVHITASLSVLLWAVEPVLILFLAAWFLRERVGGRLVGLSAVAVAGMVLVIHDPGAGGHLLGVALTLGGIACCAVYTVVARSLLRRSDATLPVVVAQQAWALAFALVVGLLTGWGGPAGTGTVSAEAWLSAGVSGLLYYGVAYWLYLTGLRRVPASFAAVSFYLIPVFGVAAGMGLLGERLGPLQWLGAAVVLVAVLAIARSAPGEEAPSATPAMQAG